MLFKNSKASIEQWDTHINGPQIPCSHRFCLPAGFRCSPTPPSTHHVNPGGDGALTHSHADRRNLKLSWSTFHWDISWNALWDVHTYSHITADRDTVTSPIHTLTHTHSHTHRERVSCRVANIFPRSNLTRNSNEIKCHQCDFSPFLLIVLGNGIRTTDDRGHGAVNPLPFLVRLSWYLRYLIQSCQLKHINAIMFIHISMWLGQYVGLGLKPDIRFQCLASLFDLASIV